MINTYAINMGTFIYNLILFQLYISCNKVVQIINSLSLANHLLLFNPLTPNESYSGRTAPLTSKVAFYIY